MSRWSEVGDAAFKPIEGGYVFQSRKPWFIGPSRHYLVTEAQKAEIIAQLGRSHRRAVPWTIAMPLAMVALIVISVNWLKGPVGNEIMAFVVAFTFGIGFTLVQHVFMIRTLAPLVAGLPTTTERITLRGQIEHVAMSRPYWLIIGVGALAGLSGATLGVTVVLDVIDAGRIDPSLYMPAAGAVLAMPCGLYALYLAMLKRKLVQQAS